MARITRIFNSDGTLNSTVGTRVLSEEQAYYVALLERMRTREARDSVPQDAQTHAALGSLTTAETNEVKAALNTVMSKYASKITSIENAASLAELDVLLKTTSSIWSDLL